VAAGIAAPAIAQNSPVLKWRLTAVVPRSLEVHWGMLEVFAKQVREMTDDKFQIQLFAAGEIVGPLQSFDAVSNGNVEMALTALHYFIGKSPAYPVMSSLPFGMNTRQMNAWLYEGGGIELCNSILSKQNIYALPGGSPGEQMGGWFRKEVNTVADLKGLRFRVPGLAGDILTKLGVVPQMIAAGDVYQALERGTIDAAKFIQPSDDEKQGFVKVAPYYYYPSAWEGASLVHYAINLAKWNDLPQQYKTAITTASTNVNFRFPAAYDVRCAPAIRRLVASGAQLRPFSPEILEAAYKAANEIYDDFSAKDADFKKIYEVHKAMRDDIGLWNQIAEQGYNSMQARLRARKA
jgi:TRAP-type mannitol/chloroaromatic compound transport system substrate-binding protein